MGVGVFLRISGYKVRLKKVDERFHVWKRKGFPRGRALQGSYPQILLIVALLPKPEQERGVLVIRKRGGLIMHSPHLTS